MKRKKSKTIDTNHSTTKARLKTPCTACGGWWVILVKSEDGSKFGHRCINCNQISLWDVPENFKNKPHCE